MTRLRDQAKVRTDGGRECTAAEPAPAPGASWRGRAEVFKESGWRAAAVAARWRRDRDGPWLLVSGRDDGARLSGRYLERTWTEELSKDEGSGGFRWERSQVRDPGHAAGLMAVIAPATYPALAVGSRVLEAGRRSRLDTGTRRALSRLQTGLRMARSCPFHDRHPPSNLSPAPP